MTNYLLISAEVTRRIDTNVLVCVIVLLLHTATSDWVVDLNLPSKLLEYTIRNDPVLRQKCQEGDCPFSEDTLSNGRCWGYEKNCSFEDSYSAEFGFPKCASANKRRRFFDDADFGYVLKRSNIYEICSPSNKVFRPTFKQLRSSFMPFQQQKNEGSRLRCSHDLHYCHGVNIFFHFKSWNATNSKRYRDDIIQPGEVGGNCGELNRELLSKNLNEPGYLRSWADELKHFVSVPSFVVNYENCDIIFERSAIVMKLDASVNMYHHFCDFVNLYASQHINGSFSQQVDVVWWDTFNGGYIDASFGETWKVFSNSKPVELTALAGHRVCFRNALFPLLARQRFGLYYNMPLEEGCNGSGLMHAFSQYIIHRLRIVQRGPRLDSVRITVLSRSTHYRRILNLNELLKALEDVPNTIVKVVDYNERVPFLSQLDSTHNSDVFIGIHGAGLTHLLFLPDWAAVMELYNCDDRHCYKDLARLRGVKYFTWSSDKQHLIYPEGGERRPGSEEPHKKFMNYRFDPMEFQKRVKVMVDFVRRHSKFVEERRRLRRMRKLEEL